MNRTERQGFVASLICLAAWGIALYLLLGAAGPLLLVGLFSFLLAHHLFRQAEREKAAQARLAAAPQPPPDFERLVFERGEAIRGAAEQ